MMKRVLSHLNTIIAVFLAFVLALMIGFLALTNPLRVDLSGRGYYKLSEKTMNLLRELDQQVQVYVFFQEEHDLHHDIENLLEEYEYASRNIRTEWIDPARDPARTEKLRDKYGLTESEVIVFVIGDASKVVHQKDLVDMVAMEGRSEPVMTAFKGEQAFSSAIHALIQQDIPRVYFLVGHGERRINDFDPRTGFSDIRHIIERDNLSVDELILSGQQQIPDDAALLVIAGPTEKMSSIEVDMIEAYLDRSGRVMILLDALADGGLTTMLNRWGVAIRQDIVVDPENTLRGSDVHIRRYTDHPISIAMQSICQFILPRSVEPLAAGSASSAEEDRPVAIPLALTSEKSWSETQVTENSARFDEGSGDRRGPNSLAVAVERGASSRLLDVQIRPSRMVVFGDSDFVGNGTMVGGNPDLFMNAVNWLLDRQVLMAIAPKPIEEVKLSLSHRQLTKLFWINIVGVPSLAAVLGLLVWSRRRR